MEMKEPATLHHGHVGPRVDRLVDAIELRFIAAVRIDEHVLMRPLRSVGPGLRPDNALDQRNSARDLLALGLRILGARSKDRGDTPPLISAQAGMRSLAAAKAVTNGELRWRRIGRCEAVEIESVEMVGILGACGQRKRSS